MEASPMLVKPGMALTKDGSKAAMVTSTSATTIGVTYLFCFLSSTTSSSSSASSSRSTRNWQKMFANTETSFTQLHSSAPSSAHSIRSNPRNACLPNSVSFGKISNVKAGEISQNAIFLLDATNTFHVSSDKRSFRSKTTPKDSFGSFSQCSMEVLFLSASFLSFTGTRIVFFARKTLWSGGNTVDDDDDASSSSPFLYKSRLFGGWSFDSCALSPSKSSKSDVSSFEDDDDDVNDDDLRSSSLFSSVVSSDDDVDFAGSTGSPRVVRLLCVRRLRRRRLPTMMMGGCTVWTPSSSSQSL